MVSFSPHLVGLRRGRDRLGCLGAFPLPRASDDEIESSLGVKLLRNKVDDVPGKVRGERVLHRALDSDKAEENDDRDNRQRDCERGVRLGASPNRPGYPCEIWSLCNIGIVLISVRIIVGEEICSVDDSRKRWA